MSRSRYLSRPHTTSHFNHHSSLSHLDGAAHEGLTLVGLQHDLEQVVGRLLDVIHLGDAAAKVLHGLAGGAALQRLIRAVQSAGNGPTLCKETCVPVGRVLKCILV